MTLTIEMKKENKQDYETPMMECLHLCRGVDLLIRFSSEIQDEFEIYGGDNVDKIQDDSYGRL